MKRTVAITVNYNNYKDTIEAIESLLNETYAYYRIIIVDNCSPNESIHMLNKAFEATHQVVLIKSDRNGGYAYGINLGMRYAIKHIEFDYFLVINNDTITDENLNRTFIRYYETNKTDKIGLLCGKIYYYDDNNKRIWFAGGYFYKKKCKGRHYGGGQIDNGQYNEIKEVSFATGCLWFFEKDLIDCIGFLPEEYFMYYEDLDFSLKVQKNGYKIIYIPEAQIFHKVGASIALNDEKSNTKNLKTNLSNTEKIIIARKYLSFPSRLRFMFWLIYKNIERFFRYLFKHRKSVNTFQGVVEGIKYNI